MKRLFLNSLSTSKILIAAGAILIGPAMLGAQSLHVFAQETKAAPDEMMKTEKRLSPEPATEQYMNSDEQGSESAAKSSQSAGYDSIFISEQRDDEVTANHYIGRAVYNTNQETVGDINDLVFTKDGGIRAAIIGVGGFLGIGEKNVAVRFDAIKIVENSDDGRFDLVINAPREMVGNAPEYITKQQKRAEERAAKLAHEQAQSSGLTPEAPVSQ